MKPKSTQAGASLAMGCGLAFCIMGANRLSADTWVTFQVDMSVQANLGRFNPLTQSVIAMAYEWHGGDRLPSWHLQLTNEPAATNPYLYRGTGLITNDAPGAVLSYEFCVPIPGGGSSNWESTTRSARLPDAEGASPVLPVVYFDDRAPGGNVVTNTIALTFQVDMTAQSDLGEFKPQLHQVEVGAKCDPGTVTYGYLLTNNPHSPNPNLYATTVKCENYTRGGILKYRFGYYSAGRYIGELPLSTFGKDRTETLPATDEPSLVLPVVYFDDLPAGVPLVTNDVTFQVDVSAQRPAMLAEGLPEALVPRAVACTVSVRGGYLKLTNSNDAINTNLYRGTLTTISLPEAHFEYRFEWMLSALYGRHEEESRPRQLSLLATNGSIVLPVVLYDDLAPNDVVPRSTVVRFSVDMAGAVTTDGHPFHPILDRVFVNGEFVRWLPNGCEGCIWRRDWAPWDPVEWNSNNYYLTNVPGTQVYTGGVTIDPSERLALTYRYGINGQDNEPPGGQNHVRYIRNAGEYTLPLDKFGAPVQEPSFGNLTATRSDQDHVLISWLGSPRRPPSELRGCVRQLLGRPPRDRRAELHQLAGDRRSKVLPLG